MLKVLLAAAAVALPISAFAGTTQIDTSKVPAKTVHEVASLTPLALGPDGAPAVVLLDLDAGDVVPPHAAKSGLRLLTVVKGEMSWGDGDAVDQAKETVYPAGSILTVPAGVDHWLAARNGDVRIQLIVLDDETPVPAVRDQMK